MRVCPKCGYEENVYWQQDRFAQNLMFMRIEDFSQEYPILAKRLLHGENDIIEGTFIYRLKKHGKYVNRMEMVTSTAKQPFYARYESAHSWTAKSMQRLVNKVNAARSKNQTKLVVDGGKETKP